MDRDNCLRPANQGCDLVDQIIQGVSMLSEDDELSSVPSSVEHLGIILQELRQLIPLAIFATAPNSERQIF